MIKNKSEFQIYLVEVEAAEYIVLKNRSIIDFAILYQSYYNQSIKGDETIIEEDFKEKLDNLLTNLRKINELINTEEYLAVSDYYSSVKNDKNIIHKNISIKLNKINLLNKEVILYVKTKNSKIKNIRL